MSRYFTRRFECTDEEARAGFSRAPWVETDQARAARVKRADPELVKVESDETAGEAVASNAVPSVNG